MDSRGTLRYILSVFPVPILDRVPSKTLVDLLWAFGEAHVVGLGVRLHHHLSNEKKGLSAPAHPHPWEGRTNCSGASSGGESIAEANG